MTSLIVAVNALTLKRLHLPKRAPASGSANPPNSPAADRVIDLAGEPLGSPTR